MTGKPNYAKYGYKDSGNLFTLQKAIDSIHFGGSVFLPVAKKGSVRNKINPLQRMVDAAVIDEVYGGGYYHLQDIRESKKSDVFLNVHLLTQKIDNQEVAQKIKLWHDMYVQNLNATPLKELDAG